MNRRCCFLLLIAALPLRGQEPKPTETIVTITVSPAAAPVPALSIMLQPSLLDMIPGNPVLGYLKCFMEQQILFGRSDVLEERQKLLDLPFDDFKKAKSDSWGELRKYGGVAVLNARRATRLETPDWNIVQEMQENGYNTLLPEIQKLRDLARVVSLRSRGEIAAGEFDEAIKDITVQLTLGKHLGEHPTYIGTLVGLAIARVGLDRVAEFVQQPKAPNLYWALSTLPQPLVRQERALLGELAMYPAGLKNLTDPAKIWGKDEVRQAREFAAFPADISNFSPKKREEIDQWLKARLTDKEWLGKARLEIMSPVRSTPMIEKYPAEQVLFLAILARAEIRLHDQLKYSRLPSPQVVEWSVSSRSDDATPPEEAVTHALSSSTWRARLAQIRLEQQIAMLRAVEAVRLYAAANDGKLPPDLKATKVPVPIDPVNGQPITYQVTDNAAQIRGASIKGMEKDPVWNLVYRVTIRK